MLYIIGDYDKYKHFISKIICGLNDSNSIYEESFKCSNQNLIYKTLIKTKYYQTNINIKYQTILEFINYDHSNIDDPPNAILVLMDQNILNLNFFEKLNQCFSCNEITRLCCLFNLKNIKIISDQKNALIHNCNNYNYELISILFEEDNDYLINDNYEFKYQDAIIRIIQALQCTNWDNINKICNNNQYIHNLQDSLDSFDLLISMTNKINKESKNLSDFERRKRASNAIYNIVRHLDLDLKE